MINKAAFTTQRAQYGLVKECTINHIEDPHMFKVYFLISHIGLPGCMLDYGPFGG